MDQTNLDIYGHAPLPWSRAAEQVDAAVGQSATHFLATVRPDGRPHVAGVGALWVDGKFYFTSGAGTRKSRNLAEKADCVISVKLPDLDLVVEGAATKVTDEPTLQRLAERYDAQGWPATVKDGAFIAPFSAERRATAVGPLRIHAKHRVRRGDSRAIRGHPLALRRLTGIRDPKPNLATIQSCGFRALWSAIRAQL